ncbi:MAG: hypothetical protein WDZ72_02735 [Cyclobacteriaceae bacterium]
MIICKPKKSTYISLGLVVVILIAGLSYFLYDFYHHQTFGLFFYLIACSFITVVLLLILVKMMAGFKYLFAGKEKIEVWVPLKGLRKKYTLHELLAWQEEEIKANKKVFKQLILVFSDKYSISLSNQEHLGYDDLRKYLMKKSAKKKIKP